MKKTLIIIFILISQFIFSQRNDELRKNNFTLEALGHSESLISVNYERIFYTNLDKLLYSSRIGLGYVPGGEKNENYAISPSTTTVPFVFSVLYGEKHFVQLGLGYSALFSQDFVDTRFNPNTVYKKFESDFSISIGYRFMTKDGIVAQAYPVFILKDNPATKSMLSFGVSLGYSF